MVFVIKSNERCGPLYDLNSTGCSRVPCSEVSTAILILCDARRLNCWVATDVWKDTLRLWGKKDWIFRLRYCILSQMCPDFQCFEWREDSSCTLSRSIWWQKPEARRVMFVCAWRALEWGGGDHKAQGLHYRWGEKSSVVQATCLDCS